MSKSFIFPSRIQSSILCQLTDRRRISLALAGCFLWCHVCARQAHAEPGLLELDAKFAPSLEEFSGSRTIGENAYKLGASAGAGLRYGIVGPLAAQLEILHATRGTDVAVGDTTAGSFYFRYLEIPLLARVTWQIPGLADGGRRSPLSAHLVAGVAASYLLGAVREDGSGTQELARDDLNVFDGSAIAGLGLTWNVTPRWAASFEVRYDMGFVDVFPDATGGGGTRNRAILFALGVGYTLNDGDGDGVAGSRDRCRTRAEDWNGFEDRDGCPDADDDGDGFRGDADACPGEAEDMNEYRDEDGCPDASGDDDGDGIVNQEDVCPTQTFPYNAGLAHERRGCPPGLDRVRVEVDRIELTPPLVFDFGSSQLTAEHEATLRQVAELLRDYYPGMRLRIEGHADSGTRGKTRRDNLEESRRRAMAVKTYLMAQGIDEEHLVARGYGEDNPDFNEDSKGEGERNRRVELIVIE